MNRYEALRIAVEAHAGQVDKCGRPYILHPIAVARAIENAKPHEVALNDADWSTAIGVALIHDVLEDTDRGIGEFEIPPAAWAALRAVTRRPNEAYADYMGRIAQQPVAAIVKLADLWDNLQPERLACLPSKEAASLEARYLKARDRIWKALGLEWWPSSSKEEGR